MWYFMNFLWLLTIKIQNEKIGRDGVEYHTAELQPNSNQVDVEIAHDTANVKMINST